MTTHETPDELRARPPGEQTAAEPPVDLRHDWRLAVLHGLEHRLFSVMKSWGIPGPGILRRLIRLLIPAPPVDGPVIVSTNWGVDLQVDPIENPTVDRDIFERGVYEPGTMGLLSQFLRDGDTFVDVGANIGFMTLSASVLVGPSGRVIAVEPIPDTFRVLRFNVALNGVTNVETCPLALGSMPGAATMYERPSLGRGAASLVRGSESGQEHQVFVKTLDSLLEELSVPSVALLKVDVEGWELEVLQGSRQLLSSPLAPAIIVECSSLHHAEIGQQAELFSLLISLDGYRIFRPRLGKDVRSLLVEVRDPADLPAHDNLVLLRNVHLERLRGGIRS